MRFWVSTVWCALTCLLGAGTVWSGTASITITWTAPGDNGLQGWASQYDLRYSLSPITNTNWASATKVANIPAPKPAGNKEIFKVTGLLPATTYYLALKTADARGNWSALSNNAIKMTCPGYCVVNGNFNGSTDNQVDLSDLTMMTLYLTNPNSVYTFCTEMGNVNGSAGGVIDVSDLSRLVAYLTKGTPIAPCLK